MTNYRIKRVLGSWRVQVRFFLFWRTLAVYPFSSSDKSNTHAKNQALAIARELGKRSN